MCHVLTRYSHDLRVTLDRTYEVSPSEWQRLQQMAISLCHQMNRVKREPALASLDQASLQQEDNLSLYFYHFLSDIKEVHERLNRLRPMKVREKKLNLHISKYFYHKKQIALLKKRFWRDLTRKLFKKGPRNTWKLLKAEVIDEIARHQIEMQSASLLVIQYSRPIDLEF